MNDRAGTFDFLDFQLESAAKIPFFRCLRLTKYDRFNAGDVGESPTNASYRMKKISNFRILFEKQSIKSMLIEGGSKKYTIGGKTTNGMPMENFFP